MEEILMKHGYRSQNENEWVKNSWTVRIDATHVEVFNEPDNGPGKYYIAPKELIDLDTLLIEIDEHLMR